MAGYGASHKGAPVTRKDLFNSLSPEVLCDFVYVLFTKNMDENQKEEFDDLVFQPEDNASDEARERRRQIVMELGGLG